MLDSLYELFIEALAALFVSWAFICTWHELMHGAKPKPQPEEETEK